MKLKIIAVGKVREKYYRDGIDEYLKRLTPYARVSVVEVEDEPIPEKASVKEEEAVKDKEGERILRQLRPGSYTIALAVQGREMSSEELAASLADLSAAGREVNLVIGGSLGLSAAVLRTADCLLSFSRFTFPHQLMRLILVEQLYRACKIGRGETYHR